MLSVREKVTAAVADVVDGGLIVADDWNVVVRGDRYVARTYADYRDGNVEPGENRDIPCACPLGAVLIAQDPRPSHGGKDKDAAAVLGVSERWVESFVAGFDAGSPLDPDADDDDNERAELSAAYAFGEEMREKHIDDDDDDDDDEEAVPSE